MSARRSTHATPEPADELTIAIEAAEHLRRRSGLAAVTKHEGKKRIIQGQGRVLGSVAIDEDCCQAFPNDARWDYVLGVSAEAAIAFFVEVHSAETSAVSKMHDKLVWLLDFLSREPQERLQRLPREVRWIASGRVNIPENTPQCRRLRMKPLNQLRGPSERLELP